MGLPTDIDREPDVPLPDEPKYVAGEDGDGDTPGVEIPYIGAPSFSHPSGLSPRTIPEHQIGPHPHKEDYNWVRRRVFGYDRRRPWKRQKRQRTWKKLDSKHYYRRNKSEIKARMDRWYKKVKNDPTYKSRKEDYRETPKKYERQRMASQSTELRFFIPSEDTYVEILALYDDGTLDFVFDLTGEEVEGFDVGSFLYLAVPATDADEALWWDCLEQLPDEAIQPPSVDTVLDVAALTGYTIKDVEALESYSESDLERLLGTMTGMATSISKLAAETFLYDQRPGDDTLQRMDGPTNNGVGQWTKTEIDEEDRKPSSDGWPKVNPEMYDSSGSGRVIPEHLKHATLASEMLKHTSPDVLKRAKTVKSKLVKADPDRGQWLFQASGSDGGTYKIRVWATPQGTTKDINKLNLRVSCSCDFFRWQGPEHWAVRNGYLAGKPSGTASAPTEKDPSGKHWVCKHLAHVLTDKIGQYRVASFKPLHED